MRLQQLQPRLWRDQAAVSRPSPLCLSRQQQQRPLRRRLPHQPRAAAASAADAGEPPAAAAADSSSSGRPRWLRWLPDAAALRLVSDAWALLASNLWAVVLLFLAKDAAAFVLHRLAHRLTNHIAESALGLPISSLGNPWWIMVDAQFVQGHFGYQALVGCFFLLCLPLNILFNTAAVATAAVVCSARQAAAATAARAPGPAASFTGQGSGKVGLAECRSAASSVSSIDMLGSDEFTGPAAALAVSSALGSSSSSSSGASGSYAAVGVASFAGSGGVTFRAASFGGSSSSSSKKAGKRQSSSSSSSSSNSGKPQASSSSSSSSSKRGAPSKPKQQRQPPPPPPAAAAPVPWIAAAATRPRPLLLKPLGLRDSIGLAREAWAKRVAPQLAQLWEVDLRFNLWALPLQAACLAVLPTVWAFPRLLDLQLALPAAVLGGQRGAAALQASRALMAGFRTNYAWPFVWLIAAARLVEVARELVLVAIPVRWWSDVVEVPLLGTAAFAIARLLLVRLQDLVPVAAYLALTRSSSGSSSSSSSATGSAAAAAASDAPSSVGGSGGKGGS